VEELASAQMIDLGIAEFPFERPGFEREDFCRIPYVMAHCGLRYFEAPNPSI